VIHKLISICFPGLIIGQSWVIKAAFLLYYIPTCDLSSIYKKPYTQTCVIVQMTERMNGDSQNEVVTYTRIKLNIIPDYAGIQYGFAGTSASVGVRAIGCILIHTNITKLSAFTVTKSAY